MSQKSSLLALAAVGAVLSAQAVAQAQSNVISFSFSGNSNSPQFVDPTLTAGVVPAKNFNTDNGGNSGGVTGLTNGSGTAVATSLTYNSYDAQSGSLAKNSTYSSDANQQLFNGFIESGPPAATNAAATVTVSSVPFTTYNLYVYFFNGAQNTAATTTGTYTVTSGTGGATRASQNAVLQNTYSVNTPFTLATATTAGDYLVFTGLTGTSFTLTANRVTGDTASTTFIPIDGFQIVQAAAAPEPAAFVPVVLGLGMVGLLAARRRRQGTLA